MLQSLRRLVVVACVAAAGLGATCKAPMSDWLREDLRRRSPVEAGVYDLGRYGNL